MLDNDANESLNGVGVQSKEVAESNEGNLNGINNQHNQYMKTMYADIDTETETDTEDSHDVAKFRTCICWQSERLNK